MPTKATAPHRAAGALTVHSMGGLGNQLFIYGAGLAAAEHAGVRLRVDIGQHAAREDRPPLLEGLGLPAEYVDLGLRETSSSLRRRLARRWPPGEDVPLGCTYRESGFGYDPGVLRQEPGSCLFGYFQSWRYLEPVADRLRCHLGDLVEMRRERLEAYFAPLDDPSAVVLHVRRGDYLHVGAEGYHGLAGYRFYRDALATLRRMGFDGPVHLFSDDVATARRELGGLGEIRSVDSPSLDALDEMLLMSRAPALVTANSSFSWWAAWLGDRADRPVVAPRPWFDEPSIDARDLLPPHWLTLDRRDVTRERQADECG